jgi:hypothetical protein
MADPHVTATPGITYEHKDIDPHTVFWAGVGFAGLCLVGLGVALLMFQVLRWRETTRPDKEPALPQAAVDEQKGLPPIPLEQIVDVQDHNVKLWPRRVFPPSEEEKDPIARAIARAAGKLKVREGTEAETAPPAGYLRRLPSKASSGRTDTGEQ